MGPPELPAAVTRGHGGGAACGDRGRNRSAAARPELQRLGTLVEVEGAQGQDVVQLQTDDGVLLHGLWRRCEEPQATIVVVHGFSASVNEPGVRRLARELGGADLDVLVYDARGHGRSGGTSAVGSAEHLDVASACAAASSPATPLVLVGISMGAVAVVRHLAGAGAAAGVAGAVLVSAPSRWQMRPTPTGIVAALLTKTLPGRSLAARTLGVRVAPHWRTGEAPESMITRVGVPVAVVHGADDRLLSPEHGERLRSCAAGPARLDIVTGMGHGVRHRGFPEVLTAVRWIIDASRPARPVDTPLDSVAVGVAEDA